MPDIRLSPLAEQDIEKILAWTHEQFGESGRLRYEALLIQAILDIAAAPEGIGVLERSELFPGARTYHLSFSRNHVPIASGRVKKPRHLLLFRFSTDGNLEIARVLHDSMELSRHLPAQ